MSDDKNNIAMTARPTSPRNTNIANNANNLEAANNNNGGRRSRRSSPSNNANANNRTLSPNRRSTDRSPRRNRRETSSEEMLGRDGTPLLNRNEAEEFNPNQPPIAGPEIDDDNLPDEDIPYTPDARPGVDDSFFPEKKPNEPRQRRPTLDNGFNGHDGPTLRADQPNGHSPRPQTPNFPYAPEFGPGVIVPTEGGRIIPDVNVYQHKKTLAQGMMDLALLSANANQLRYVVESYSRHPYYYFSVVFISASLILQVAVGVGLIWNSRYNVKNEDDICKADRVNNFTVMGIFLITVVNVFVSAFGVAPSESSIPQRT